MINSKSIKPITSTTELARLAGVSRPMVSAVLNNKADQVRMSPKTRKRIESLIRKTGFRANQIGKSLATGKSALIGLLLNQVQQSYVPELIEAIEDQAQIRGRGVLLMSSRNDADRERQALELMIEKRVEGLLWSLPRKDLAVNLRRLGSLGIPSVVMGVRPPLPKGSAAVYVDAVKAGYLAIRHLIDLGHRFIACAETEDWIKEGIERARSESRERVKIVYWPTEPFFERRERFFTAWRSKSNPTALFIAHDYIACQVMNFAMRAGVKIPGELAVVGRDDIPEAANHLVPLTTLRQPRYEQGRIACDLLLDMIDHKPVKNIILEPQLVVRQSTRSIQ